MLTLGMLALILAPLFAMIHRWGGPYVFNGLRVLWPFTVVIAASVCLLLAMTIIQAKRKAIDVTRTTAVVGGLVFIAWASEWLIGIVLAGCC